MKVLVVLVFIFLSGCNGGHYEPPSQRQVEMAQDAYWQYVQQSTSTPEDYVRDIRHSPPGQYLCSLISKSIDLIYNFYHNVYTHIVRWTNNFYNSVRYEIDHLKQDLEHFLLYLEADVHHHAKELAAQTRSKLEGLKESAVHYIEALDPKGFRIALQEKIQDLHEHVDKCFEHLDNTHHHHHPHDHYDHHSHPHHRDHHHLLYKLFGYSHYDHPHDHKNHHDDKNHHDHHHDHKDHHDDKNHHDYHQLLYKLFGYSHYDHHHDHKDHHHHDHKDHHRHDHKDHHHHDHKNHHDHHHDHKDCHDHHHDHKDHHDDKDHHDYHQLLYKLFGYSHYDHHHDHKDHHDDKDHHDHKDHHHQDLKDHHHHDHKDHHHHDHHLKMKVYESLERFKVTLSSLAYGFEVKLTRTTNKLNKEIVPHRRRGLFKLRKDSDNLQKELGSLWEEWAQSQKKAD